ncbi:MAG: hypothetical protein ABI824_19015 [Acidobacteriota bacterium]
MPLRLALFFAFAAVLFAANTRLYLKDGDYHIVREYKIEGDRVLYYSVERGDWEEIPLELVDLKRTSKDSDEKAKALAEEVKIEKAEEAAVKADKKLVRSVPDIPGVYWIDGDKVVALKSAQVVISDSTTRRLLQKLSPVPIIPGKSTVEIETKAAVFRLTNRTPEFFFRLMEEERFQLIKLPPKGKNGRLVETVQRLPEDEEVLEDQKVIPTFKRQIDEGLYKIWPQEPLELGEYALVEYTEGKMNIQVWDFGIDKPK